VKGLSRSTSRWISGLYFSGGSGFLQGTNLNLCNIVALGANSRNAFNKMHVHCIKSYIQARVSPHVTQAGTTTNGEGCTEITQNHREKGASPKQA
jgi:hypothetical protein